MTGHECQPVRDEAGEVVAWALADPAMSEEAKAALVEVVAAARRKFAVQCEADPTIGERQAAAITRIRNRAGLDR